MISFAYVAITNAGFIVLISPRMSLSNKVTDFITRNIVNKGEIRKYETPFIRYTFP